MFHDLVRDFIVGELGAPARQRRTPPSCGPTAAARPRASGGRRTGICTSTWPTTWSSRPKTDQAHLVELVGLFGDQEWMRLRFEQWRYTYDGYLVDLDRCWQLLHEDLMAAIGEGGEWGWRGRTACASH